MAMTAGQARFWGWLWLGAAVVSAVLNRDTAAYVCLTISAVFLVGSAILRKLN